MPTRASNAYPAIYLGIAVVFSIVTFVVMAVIGAGASVVADYLSERLVSVVGAPGSGIVTVLVIAAGGVWARRLHVREQRRQFALDQTIHVEKRDWGRVFRYSIPLLVVLSIFLVVSVLGVLETYRTRSTVTAPPEAGTVPSLVTGR